MNGFEAPGTSDADGGEVDKAYLNELADRWFELLDRSAATEDPAVDPPCVAARNDLVSWLLVADDPDAVGEGMAYEIAGGLDEIMADQPDLAPIVLRECGLLCQSLASAPFVHLVLTWAEGCCERTPELTLKVLADLEGQLDRDPALAAAVAGDGVSAEIARLEGFAWLELEDAARAQAAFLVSYATAQPDDRPGLEFLIGSCLGVVGDWYEAADWALRSIDSAQALSHEVDPEFVASAAESLVGALSERRTGSRPPSDYDRFVKRYLAHPEWVVPLIGEPGYLAAAAELLADRGEFDAAIDCVERAEAAWARGPELPAGMAAADLHGEIILAKVLVLVGSGQVDRAMRCVREAVPIVAGGSADQVARLSMMVAALMSSLGQSHPAWTELDRIRRDGVRAGAPGPDGTPERVQAALGLTHDMLGLTHATLEASSSGSVWPELARRWETLGEEFDRVGGPGEAEMCLVFAAAIARSAGLTSLGESLMQRASAMRGRERWDAGVSGRDEFVSLFSRMAAGSTDLLALVDTARRSLDSSNPFFASTMSLMHTVSSSATGASSRDILASACRALDAHARWRGELPSSEERATFDRRLTTILPLAYDALIDVDDARLTAEFIEFVRSQAMPEAQAVGSHFTVGLSRLLMGMGAGESSELVPLDDEIVLRRPSQVRMPWGSIALVEMVGADGRQVVDLEVDV